MATLGGGAHARVSPFGHSPYGLDPHDDTRARPRSVTIQQAHQPSRSGATSNRRDGAKRNRRLQDVTYRVTGFLIEPHEDVRVEYRIKNWLLAQRVECRFHLPDHHWTHWAEKQHVQFAHMPRDDDAQSYRTELVCEGSHRHVGFSEDSTFAAL
jgi:hypothetical protein